MRPATVSVGDAGRRAVAPRRPRAVL